MSRIAEEEIDNIKRTAPLADLVRASGVALEHRGSDLFGRCPFHDDRTPSLVVSPKKNLWHCLGACQTGGSVIDWVMKSEGVDFRAAVELLKSRAPSLAACGSAAESEAELEARSSKPEASAPEVAPEEAAALMKRVVAYYHRTLLETPAALSYLESRRLDVPELIERFQLGYANRTLGGKLPPRSSAEGARMRDALRALGVLKDNGHEHLSARLIVPVFDAAGVPVELYGRRISDRAKGDRHLYLPGPHRGVFNRAALTSSPEIIVCESLIDALTLIRFGFDNATTSFCAGPLNAELLDALRAHHTLRVVIAYDGDVAGDAGAKKVIDQLDAVGIGAYRAALPRGMDINQYAQRTKPEKKSLGFLLGQAQWVGKGEAPDRLSGWTKREALLVDSASSVPPSASSPPSLAASSGTVEEAALNRAAKKREDETVSHPRGPGGASTTGAPTQGGEEGNADQAGEGESGELPALVPEGMVFRFGDRRYRVRGLERCLSFGALKVNILISKGDDFFVDTVDLYSARQRRAFLEQAASDVAVERDVLKHDLGKLLRRLEAIQEREIQQTLAPKDETVVLTPEQEAEALELLTDENLIQRILSDFVRCGVVGEETNKLVGYLAAVSRKLGDPLAIIIQSSSAAGKSSLMESILAFVPDEDRVKYSAMTGQSLFYMGETNLKHKILAIVEEEGAERASYALKLLQSEHELTIAATGKDPTSGRLVTHEYRVEGPVMIFLTTTAVDIDDELRNRAIVLTVDEDRAQTRAIHQLQRKRETLEGILETKDKSAIRTLHKNAQRLLRPLAVANPFAESLTFIDHQTRARRDHMKYLVLIRSIALLSQYQRPVKTARRKKRVVEYIEVEPKDIELANVLCHQVLSRSMGDLPPQTTRFLGLLEDLVFKMANDQGIEPQDVRFSRRDACESTGWSYAQVRVHLEKLVELEYVLVHAGRRGRCFVYELMRAPAPASTGGLPSRGLEAVVAPAEDDTNVQSLTPQTGGLIPDNPEFADGLTPHLSPIDPPLRRARSEDCPSDSGSLSDAISPATENAHGQKSFSPTSDTNVGDKDDLSSAPGGGKDGGKDGGES